MDSRDFIKSAAGGALASAGLASRPSQAQVSGPVPGPQPNILFVLVDELRFPSVFPSSVTATDRFQAVDQFLSQYMPNVHALWQSGVKFGSHYTAASACSPARGRPDLGSLQSADLAAADHQERARHLAGLADPAAEPSLPRPTASCCARPGTRRPISASGTSPSRRRALLPVSRILRMIPGCMSSTASTAAPTRTRTAPTCKGPSAITTPT